MRTALKGPRSDKKPGLIRRPALNERARSAESNDSRRQRSKVVSKAPPTNRLTLPEALVSVWRQVLVEGQSEITLGRRRYAVDFTPRKQLRTIAFSDGRRRFFGIEQNPRTESRWAALARAGKPVMQFSHKGRYIASVSGGKVFRYPAWRNLRLPE